MKKIIMIYDDCKMPSGKIQNITGGKSFGDTILKRKTLKERTFGLLKEYPSIAEIKETSLDERINIRYSEEERSIVYLFSNFGIRNTESFKVLLEKASYINEIYCVKCNGQAALAIFPNAESYDKFIKDTLSQMKSEEDLFSDRLAVRMAELEELNSDAFVDLSDVNHFLQFITSGFDARYFNALKADECTVTKESSNIQKIKSEYNFYYLLPESMKMWFVMPFNYTENSQEASYTMERYHMPDIAVRYVHGAVSCDEFEDILHKLFRFIKSRQEKSVDSAEYQAHSKKLYLTKVEERLAELKQHPIFETFEAMIHLGTKYQGIDEIFEKYKMLYQRIHSVKQFRQVLVVGHGDLCFSNILYNREVALLRLIDPKGALTEEELYTNPYYDLAKLSHSICGNYDFFNSGLFQITVEDNMQLQLSVDADTAPYAKVFKKYLEQMGFDYRLVRLYEASLFLSMLPLHIDQEKKVFAFLLNAIAILEEIDKWR